MNSLKPATPVTQLEAILETIRQMTDDQRQADIDACFLRMSDTVVQLACHVRYREEAGLSLDDFRTWYGRDFTAFLRLVAYGSLDALAVRRFYRKPKALKAIAALPLPDQRRLAEGGVVEVMLARPGMPPDTIQRDPLDMTSPEIEQVFDGDHIRDLSQQRAFLEHEQRPKTPKEIVSDATIDKERGTAFMPRGHYTKEQLRKILRALEQ